MKNGQLIPGYDVQMATESQLKVAGIRSVIFQKEHKHQQSWTENITFSAQLFYFGAFRRAPFLLSIGDEGR
ncbi:hypothetical protein [Paenibacillus taiwanensis]|uniref:hypothetical protein n=1 Tax=Paenibacillus taiwanensis TaxID=401638 RepID=UPI00041E0341|nr:hypothetical protein [Paenibacillus taiwanensis]